MEKATHQNVSELSAIPYFSNGRAGKISSHIRNLKIAVFTFALVLFSGLFSSLGAHSVQVAYCVSCNGDLRIFVEHWHGTESLSSTTMTISLTINNVTTTQTQSPVTGIYNTTLANLPGCSTPIIVAAACPGQANMYNNWVAFDYTGIPCNVPCSFTIISGNTVFTSDGCGMYPLTVNFTVPCGSTILQDIYCCDGVATSPIVVPVNTTWTNSNPGIGLPSSGVGDIPSFIPVGPTNSATISYINSCTTSTFTIYVTPSPTASFTATTVCAGLTTQFTNTSSAGNNATWSWDFGDATTSTMQNPPGHIYSGPGTYVVTLIATDSAGCNNTFTLNVIVDIAPIPAFTAANFCLGDLTQFTNGTPGTNSYAWNFGTGTSVLQDPAFTFPSVGTFPVSLVVTSNSGCIDSISQNITINPIPVASFVYNQACGYSSANFSSTSTVTLPSTITSTTWDFGDPASAGNNTSAIINPSHTFTANGTYTVTITVTSSNGCSSTTTQTITVVPPPTAAFTANTVCQNSPMQFTNQSLNAVTYHWDFGTTATNDTSNLSNPTYTYTSNGNYTVTLITNPGPCSDTSTVTVTVDPAPVVAFTAPAVCFGNTTVFTDQSIISSGTITSWHWDFGVGSTTTDTSNLQNPTYAYGAPGTYTVTLTCYSANGCSFYLSQPVIVNALPVANFSTSAACQGFPTTLTDLSVPNAGTISTWSWNFGDASPNSALQNPSHTYPNDSTFNTTLIVTNTPGCVDTFTLAVTINPLPIVAFAGDTLAGCPIHCVNFTDLTTVATGSVSAWTWDFGDSTSTSSQQNPSHCFVQTGAYTITLTTVSNNGCTTTLVMPNYVTVYPVPVASFSATPMVTSILSPNVIFNDLSQGSPVIWHWDFGDPSTDSDTSNHQNTSYEFSSEYGAHYNVNLIVTNQYGCVDDTTIEIIIEPDFSFFIPNAFTPNGDGINEGFFGQGYGITKYEIWIFDRWGNLIFTTKDINEAWDGSVQGRGGDLVQQDVYVWKVVLSDVFDKQHKYIGHVSVIR
ncbi:hypothetical protein BH09BAC5_BH09BAC5_20590 [soil metagenome]